MPSLFIDESISEELGLSLKGVTRIARIFHQRDFLGEQTRDVHGVGVGFLGFPLVQGMIAIDIDSRSLAERFWTCLAEMIQATGNPRLSHFEAAHDRIWS